MKRIATTMIALLVTFLLITPAFAGPPLLCHEIEIGDAKSLPWGKDTFTTASDYSVANVANDTLDLLKPDTAVLVRMETLRRATIYLQREPARAEQLLGRLMARALNAEAEGKADAMSWFDAGYFAQSLAQAGVPISFGPGVTKGTRASAIAGYSWVAHAIDLAKDSPEMHVAAALMIVDAGGAPEFEAHVRKALAARVDEKPAARDLLEWTAQINGSTLEELRDKLARRSDGARD